MDLVDIGVPYVVVERIVNENRCQILLESK